MLGTARRKQVTEQVTRAVRSAGGLMLATLAVACVALAVAIGAAVLAVKARPAT